MSGRVLRALLILPGAALVVPAAILVVTRIVGVGGGAGGGHEAPAAFLAGLFALGGVALAVWTLRLLVSDRGRATALVDEDGRLVVAGPYLHCRNPTICAALLLVAAEALWFDSWPLAVWLAIFFLICAVYIRRLAERQLEARFGAAYRHYKARVPRWFPSPMAYDPDEQQERREA